MRSEGNRYIEGSVRWLGFIASGASAAGARTKTMPQVRPWPDGIGSEFMTTHVQTHAMDVDQLQIKSVISEGISRWGVFRFEAVERFYINTLQANPPARERSFAIRVENAYVIGLASIMTLNAVTALNSEETNILNFPVMLLFNAISALSFVRWFTLRSMNTLRDKKFAPRNSLLTCAACIGALPMLMAKIDNNCEVIELCEKAAAIEAILIATICLLAYAAGVYLLRPSSPVIVIALTTFALSEYIIILSMVFALGYSVGLVEGSILIFSFLLVIAMTWGAVMDGSKNRRMWLMENTVASSKARKILLASHLGLLQGGSMKGTSISLTKRHRSGSVDMPGTAGDETRRFFRKLEDNSTMQRLRIDPKDLEVLEFVGRGAMGEVFEAMFLEAPVAFKRIPTSMLNEKTCEQFIMEVKILQSLRHPHVVQLMGVTWQRDSEMVGMVLELMHRGSLRSVLMDRRLLLTWEDPKGKLAIDIAKGMAFLHGQGLIHRDLKTDNILVSNTFTGKVSDFGTSKVVKEYCTTPVGTPFWRAPEVIRAEKYDSKADIYSFALILLEIHIQENPFERMSQMEAMEFPHLVAHEGYRLPLPSDMPEDIESLVKDCWLEDPKHRPPFSLIRRRLQRFLSKVSDEEDSKEENQLSKVMIDQIILSGCYSKEKYQNGDIIIRAGEDGEFCYIVLYGEVEVFVPEKQGKVLEYNEKTFPTGWRCVSTVLEGDFFGEMAMLVNQKRTATCRSRGEATVLKFDRATFTEKLDDDVRSYITRRIVDNMQNTIRRVNNFDGGKYDSSRTSETTQTADEILNTMDESTLEVLKALQRSTSSSRRSGLDQYRHMSLKYKQNSGSLLGNENSLAMSTPALRRYGSSGSHAQSPNSPMPDRRQRSRTSNTNSMPSFVTAFQAQDIVPQNLNSDHSSTKHSDVESLSEAGNLSTDLISPDSQTQNNQPDPADSNKERTSGPQL